VTSLLTETTPLLTKFQYICNTWKIRVMQVFFRIYNKLTKCKYQVNCFFGLEKSWSITCPDWIHIIKDGVFHFLGTTFGISDSSSKLTSSIGCHSSFLKGHRTQQFILATGCDSLRSYVSGLECFETCEIEIRMFWNIFNKALFTWDKNGKQRLYWQIQIKLYFKFFLYRDATDLK